MRWLVIQICSSCYSFPFLFRLPWTWLFMSNSVGASRTAEDTLLAHLVHAPSFYWSLNCSFTFVCIIWVTLCSWLWLSVFHVWSLSLDYILWFPLESWFYWLLLIAYFIVLCLLHFEVVGCFWQNPVSVFFAWSLSLVVMFWWLIIIENVDIFQYLVMINYLSVHPSVTYSCPDCNFFCILMKAFDIFVFWMWVHVDHLMTMCHVPWIRAYDLELWPHGQIPVFSLTNWCLGCNFCLSILVFDVWHKSRSPKNYVSCTMDSDLWPWTLSSKSNSCFCYD